MVGAQYNMAGMANNQSGLIAQHLAQPFSTAGAPAAGNVGQLTGAGDPLRSIGYNGPGQQFSFGEAGPITRDYGPADNYSQDRLRVEEALYGRLNPQLERERGNIEQRLADQGIRYGSQAYTSAMDDYNRQANDARLAVTQVGGQEQQRINDMAAQRAGFQNAAQQQAYTQALGRGQFANAAQRDAFQQAALGAQFYNAGQAQDFSQNQSIFNAQNVLRNQSIAEQYALRNQPINEITSLLNGSQVMNPSFLNTPSNQIANTDVAGIINNRFSQDMGIYQQQSQQYNNLMGGIFGMMGGLMRASDERIKDNIQKVGTVFAADPHGDERALPIYDYTYKADPTQTPQRGPMAQDVERINKQAVRTKKGVKYIDQTKLGSILKVA
jgi:Chaperone of endosialidase